MFNSINMTVALPDWASLLTPPPGAPRAKPPAPWNGDEADITRLADHFNAPGFQVKVKDGDEAKAALAEREMMFLVSLRLVIACRRSDRADRCSQGRLSSGEHHLRVFIGTHNDPSGC